MPSISVLMPCFNPGGFLSEALASVLAQPECLELIVADGGSTDGSLQKLQELAHCNPRLRLIIGPDEGPAHALNKAYSLARSTLIGWLNADDIMSPGALARAAHALAANPHWLMVYGEGEELDVSTGQRRHYPTLQPEVGLAGFRSHCFICQPTVVFRRTMGLLLGPFNQHLRTAFDFDYWLRAFAAFPERIGYVPTLQGLTRVHGSTITSRDRANVALEATALLAQHFGHAPPDRLHAYALELQLGVAQLPPKMAMAGHLVDLFSRARPWLSRAHYNQLRRDWLFDANTEARHQVAETEAVGYAHPAAPLLQIVQPHLRPGQPGPPANQQLRLQAAIAQAKETSLLLQEAAGFQQLLQRRVCGRDIPSHPFGVNLIKSAAASTEVLLWGEILLATLRAGQIPVATCEPTSTPGPFGINLVALSPTAHAQWWLTHGVAPHQSRLEIPVWPWIANGWPKAWTALFLLVDEVWASSRLMKVAFGQHFPSPWMVPALPLPPDLAAALKDVRPLHAPTVVMLADLGSSTHLINTFAAVDVFREAFPLPPQPNVVPPWPSPRLLILVENSQPANPEWLWLQACAAYDRRIQVRPVDALPLLERLVLIQQAHALLSLQRSFGLSSLLALAQVLGLQVVATAFGAALDLPPSPNLHLVPARCVPIPRTACLDGEGFQWGEPDRQAAVDLLRLAVRAGRCNPSKHQASQPSPIPAMLADRLRQLWVAHGGL